jgi:hypothetical protein
LGEGEGLKLALMTLNTGRLTLPAASTGIGKWCLYVAREWSTERQQWGSPIGEHEAIALKLSYIAGHTFAMDAVTWLTSFMADDKHCDIRIEAAIAKYFCTLHSWKVVDETLQIRGGQGYESADSLKARGVHSWAVERVMRDVRINLIIEGTSEIMHLFIAREALDPHLGRMKPLLSPKVPIGAKIGAALKMMLYYATWYPKLWFPSVTSEGQDLPEPLNIHMEYVKEASKRLARYVFHKMAKYQQKLESKQSILNRVVDIGTDLFAMSASCSYAALLAKKGQSNAVELADAFCHDARARIEIAFREGKNNHDSSHLKMAKKILAKEFEWMENEIIK